MENSNKKRSEETMLNGIINIYKEAGFTSHDVVAKMRGICKQKKIGHTGTLDPQAVGVLPVCLGSGTKLCDMLTDKDKEYEAELLLGKVTDTQDTTGTVLSESPVTVSEEQIREIIMGFVGDYMQVPPMYSALKVNGKKLYELARAGKEVERQARPVTILEIEILEIKLPVVKMRVACTKGTYIRTLCADIGEKAGCGGCMQSLKRTRVGRFSVKDAVTLAQLEGIRDKGELNSVLFPVESAFEELPVIHVKEEFTKFLENGNMIRPEQTVEGRGILRSDKALDAAAVGTESVGNNRSVTDTDRVRVRRSNESFAGVYVYMEEFDCYKPVKMFLDV